MKLRTLILSSLLIALVSTKGVAQFQFGGQLGMNFATLTLDDDVYANKENRTTKVGLNLGAQLNVGTENFGYQPGFIYSQQGLRAKDDFGTVGVLRLNYFRLPQMFMGKITVTDRIQIRVGGGPYLGFLLATSRKTKSSGGDVSKTDLDVGEDQLGFDFGFKLGSGVEFKLGPGELVFTPTYSFGLLPVDHPDNISDNTSYGELRRNSVVGLSTMYLFTPSEF